MAKFELTPPPEKPSKNPFKRLTESKLARAGAAAIGLHAAALSPQALEAARHAREAMSAFERSWFQENTVLHPQTKAEQEAVRFAIKQRESHIDQKAIKAYKGEQSKNIEHGKTPSFKMYFEMERLYGVPADQVKDAERKADAMIDEFSEMVGDKLDEAKIRKIVKKMYGSPANYSWEQASVTEYFRSGKRNCDSIDRAEHVVFEGVIAHLSREQQQKYMLGEREVKQHVIATLTEHLGSGKNRMYLLEPGAAVTDGTPEAGTADVSADFLKRAVVSSTVDVIHPAGGKILPSPDLDVVTNQPFPRGFVTVGDLKGADFVMDEAKREGLRPAAKEVSLDKPTEFDIVHDTTTTEQAVADLDAQVAKQGEEGYQMYSFSDVRAPSVETVAALNKRLEAGKPNFRSGIAKQDDVGDWSPEAVHEMLKSPLEQFGLGLKYGRQGLADTRERYENFISKVTDQMERMQAEGEHFHFKYISLGGAVSRDGQYIHASTKLLERFLKAVQGLDGVALYWDEIDNSEIDAILGAHVKRIDISNVSNIPGLGGDVSVPWNKDRSAGFQMIKKLSRAKAEIVINGSWYFDQLTRHPEIANYKKIIPYLEGMTDDGLDTVLAGKSIDHDPRFERITDMLFKESARRDMERNIQATK